MNASGALPNLGVGSLRWLVTLYRRDQESGPESAISDRWINLGKVHADIQPTYPSTFYGSAQIDTPITHLIRLRWADYLENVNIIARTTERPTDRTKRTELYRVRRVKEVGGRKRFSELECELEASRSTEGDSDAERELLFAEHPAAPLSPTTWDDLEVPTVWDYGETEWF